MSRPTIDDLLHDGASVGAVGKELWQRALEDVGGKLGVQPERQATHNPKLNQREAVIEGQQLQLRS